jgi:hypothetical protein
VTTDSVYKGCTERGKSKKRKTELLHSKRRRKHVGRIGEGRWPGITLNSFKAKITEILQT